MGVCARRLQQVWRASCGRRRRRVFAKCEPQFACKPEEKPLSDEGEMNKFELKRGCSAPPPPPPAHPPMLSPNSTAKAEHRLKTYTAKAQHRLDTSHRAPLPPASPPHPLPPLRRPSPPLPCSAAGALASTSGCAHWHTSLRPVPLPSPALQVRSQVHHLIDVICGKHTDCKVPPPPL